LFPVKKNLAIIMKNDNYYTSEKKRIIQTALSILVLLIFIAVVAFIFHMISAHVVDAAKKDIQIKKELKVIKKLALEGEMDKAEKSINEFFKKHGSVDPSLLEEPGGEKQKAQKDSAESKETAQLEAVLRQENRIREFGKAVNTAEKLSTSNTDSGKAIKEAEKALRLAKVEDEMIIAEDLIEKIKSSDKNTVANKGKLSPADNEKYSALFEKGKKFYNEEKYEEAVKAFDEAASVSSNQEVLEYLGKSAGMLEMKLRKSTEKPSQPK